MTERLFNKFSAAHVKLCSQHAKYFFYSKIVGHFRNPQDRGRALPKKWSFRMLHAHFRAALHHLLQSCPKVMDRCSKMGQFTARNYDHWSNKYLRRKMCAHSKSGYQGPREWLATTPQIAHADFRNPRPPASIRIPTSSHEYKITQISNAVAGQCTDHNCSSLRMWQGYTKVDEKAWRGEISTNNWISGLKEMMDW